jgi:hypothetical protein
MTEKLDARFRGHERRKLGCATNPASCLRSSFAERFGGCYWQLPSGSLQYGTLV